MQIHFAGEEIILPRCCGYVTIPTNKSFIEKDKRDKDKYIISVESECTCCGVKYKLDVTSFRYMLGFD